ncbi:MAG TPA: SHOCT domain-containing protein [Dermatophilaceae bacterium]|nr:SHOCT domain-containing protein [Dermatophilaceae bacterium]
MQDFGLWDVIVSTFWFMLLLAWIWLIISILSDIFRDHELSGWGKAWWTLLLILLPWLGALVYLIARGGSMHERSAQAAQANEERMRAYVQEAAGTKSIADKLRELEELRDGGVITGAEYEQARVKVLS